jgi:hypothetical protein
MYDSHISQAKIAARCAIAALFCALGGAVCCLSRSPRTNRQLADSRRFVAANHPILGECCDLIPAETKFC